LKNLRSPFLAEASNLILKYLMDGKGGGNKNPPPPPPPINPWVEARYGPLYIPINPHDFPYNYLKFLPKYDGEKETTTEEHMHPSKISQIIFLESMMTFL
jgi:hypothetical protein